MNLNLLIPAIGSGAIVIGLAAAIAPVKASEFFGIPATGKAVAYMRSLGVRDAFIGLSLWLAYLSDQKFISKGLLLGIAVVSATDCWMVYTEGKKKIAGTHALGIVVGVLLAIFL